MALNLIMLGPPGAGKGHAGRAVRAERAGFRRSRPATSCARRCTTAPRSALRAKAIMDRGELVSDEVMIGIVRERLDAAGRAARVRPRRVSADGGQAEALDALMDGREPLIVVDIVVPEAELVRRLASRLICADCGTNADGVDAAAIGDDALRAVRRAAGAARRRQRRAWCCERLKVYQRETAAAGRVLPRPADVPRRSTARSRRIGSRRIWRARSTARSAVARRRRERRGDCLPVGGRARADARGGPAGRRSADGAGGAGGARRDDGGPRRAGREADRARRARRRRSRGITGIRRRSARRSTTR